MEDRLQRLHMAIVRIPKVNNYTIMSNHHLTDPNLSLKAKGLISYMLSRPDNWDFTIEGLARQNMEGADAIARIIRELEARGYVIRIRTRNKAGKFMKEALGQAELDNVVSLIVEVLSAHCRHFTISGRQIPAELVKQRFQELNSLHIEYVFGCMKKAGSDIRNIKQYLLASLFNAPATMDSYYRAQVNRDLDFG